MFLSLKQYLSLHGHELLEFFIIDTTYDLGSHIC